MAALLLTSPLTIELARLSFEYAIAADAEICVLVSVPLAIFAAVTESAWRQDAVGPQSLGPVAPRDPVAPRVPVAPREPVAPRAPVAPCGPVGPSGPGAPC